MKIKTLILGLLPVVVCSGRAAPMWLPPGTQHWRRSGRQDRLCEQTRPAYPQEPHSSTPQDTAGGRGGGQERRTAEALCFSEGVLRKAHFNKRFLQLCSGFALILHLKNETRTMLFSKHSRFHGIWWAHHGAISCCQRKHLRVQDQFYVRQEFWGLLYAAFMSCDGCSKINNPSSASFVLKTFCLNVKHIFLLKCPAFYHVLLFLKVQTTLSWGYHGNNTQL